MAAEVALSSLTCGRLNIGGQYLGVAVEAILKAHRRPRIYLPACALWKRTAKI